VHLKLVLVQLVNTPPQAVNITFSIWSFAASTSLDGKCTVWICKGVACKSSLFSWCKAFHLRIGVIRCSGNWAFFAKCHCLTIVLANYRCESMSHCRRRWIALVRKMLCGTAAFCGVDPRYPANTTCPFNQPFLCKPACCVWQWKDDTPKSDENAECCRVAACVHKIFDICQDFTVHQPSGSCRWLPAGRFMICG